MNSWKLLSALILILAVTTVLASPHERVAEEPADDGIDFDIEPDENALDLDDRSKDPDDEAAELAAALREVILDNDVDKRGALSTYFSFKKIMRKIKSFGSKISDFGKKVIQKLKELGKRDLDETEEEEEDQLLREFEEFLSSFDENFAATKRRGKQLMNKRKIVFRKSGNKMKKFISPVLPEKKSTS